MKGFSKLAWAALALLGAFCLGTIALRRGEQINALWIVAAAVSIYLVAYRYYGLFIANKVLGVDPTRATPAYINNDGLDYVPTNKHVLFGHHFAAIAGAGPLVGPVLAAQMGYLPGVLWLIAGVVLAGAVQDFMVLFISTRRNGRSLGDLVREEMGPVPGTIVGLAVGILIVMPELKMPALTQFTDGTGPVWKGSMFPFLFITIACGAVSGFHALISSGTTPKLLANEGHARYIGYGGMLMESFVAIMAMVAASIIDPGIYFAMNSPAAIIGTDVVGAAAHITNEWGFAISPDVLIATAKDIGETSILSRAGGAPTLAVGIAQILHAVLPGEGMMAFWYHFAILFEALFILTAVDAGTRAGRFMLQDLLGNFVPALRRTESWTANLIATGGCVALWGYFLYQGVTDPLGGINMLWPLFGIANQMLAGIALMLCTVVLFKTKKDRYAWVSIVPTVWLLICTTAAGWIKIFDDNPGVGFIAQANKYRDAIAAGELLAPSKDFGQMQQVMVNNYINAGLTALFLFVVFSVLVYAVKAILAARRVSTRTDRETPYVALKPSEMNL